MEVVTETAVRGNGSESQGASGTVAVENGGHGVVDNGDMSEDVVEGECGSQSHIATETGTTEIVDSTVIVTGILLEVLDQIVNSALSACSEMVLLKEDGLSGAVIETTTEEVVGHVLSEMLDEITGSQSETVTQVDGVIVDQSEVLKQSDDVIGDQSGSAVKTTELAHERSVEFKMPAADQSDGVTGLLQDFLANYSKGSTQSDGAGIGGQSEDSEHSGEVKGNQSEDSRHSGDVTGDQSDSLTQVAPVRGDQLESTVQAEDATGDQPEASRQDSICSQSGGLTQLDGVTDGQSEDVLQVPDNSDTENDSIGGGNHSSGLSDSDSDVIAIDSSGDEEPGEVVAYEDDGDNDSSSYSEESKEDEAEEEEISISDSVESSEPIIEDSASQSALVARDIGQSQTMERTSPVVISSSETCIIDQPESEVSSQPAAQALEMPTRIPSDLEFPDFTMPSVSDSRKHCTSSTEVVPLQTADALIFQDSESPFRQAQNSAAAVEADFMPEEFQIPVQESYSELTEESTVLERAMGESDSTSKFESVNLDNSLKPEGCVGHESVIGSSVQQELAEVPSWNPAENQALDMVLSQDICGTLGLTKDSSGTAPLGNLEKFKVTKSVEAEAAEHTTPEPRHVTSEQNSLDFEHTASEEPMAEELIGETVTETEAASQSAEPLAAFMSGDAALGQAVSETGAQEDAAEPSRKRQRRQVTNIMNKIP